MGKDILEEVLNGPPDNEETEPTVTGEAVLEVPVGALHSWDVCEAVRQDVDGDALASLKTNIKEHGVKSPIWVTPLDDGNYAIIAGYRRFRVAKELKLKTLPAIVKTVKDPDEAKMLAILENTSRDDLREMDAFRMIEWIRTKFKKRVVHKDNRGKNTKGTTNVKELAALTGRSEFWARQHARAFDRFGMTVLDKIDQRVRTDADGAGGMTWNKVLKAIVHPDADVYENEIRQMVGEKPTKKIDKETEKKTAKLTDREVYVAVKFDALDGAGVSIKLGAKPGSTTDSVRVQIGLNMGFKMGKSGFVSGERGSQKMSKLFGQAAESINALATLGVGEDASDAAVSQRQGIREALDMALEKLAQRIAT